MIKNIHKFWDLIEKSNKILLINHIRMDMDAFWSLSAFYRILEKLNKEVKAVNDENTPKIFSFLCSNDIINPDLDLKEYNPDLIISFDAASVAQLWKTYEKNTNIFNNTNFVVIDHHKTNSWFWTINLIDPHFSSTCELTFEIIKELKLENHITNNIATSLLSWIYTDTNAFYNSNTTSNTHKVTAELMEYWADFRTPYYEFYKKKTFNKSKLWWEVLANYLKVSENWKVSWAAIPKTVFSKTNTSDRDITWLISEFLANIEWIEICFISYELDNNSIKTSFRSTPSIDSTLISWFFWGWWHKQASWFTSEKSLKEVEDEILEQIKKEFNF